MRPVVLVAEVQRKWERFAVSRSLLFMWSSRSLSYGEMLSQSSKLVQLRVQPVKEDAKVIVTDGYCAWRAKSKNDL